MKKIVKDKFGIKGIVTITNYKLKGKRAHEIDEILQNAHNISKEKYNRLILELKSLCETREIVLENLVVSVGRQVFARLLIGDTTYSGEVNYGALGSNLTAPASGDTTLNTEVARKLYALRVRSTAQVTIDFYYSKADTNGTYEEFGMFIDGTATVDTGQLFNRVLTGGWTKSAAEAMTISSQIDINAA